MKKRAWTITLELNENVRKLARRVAKSDDEVALKGAVFNLLTIGCFTMEEFLERTQRPGVERRG